jgi:hypothetical protein
MESTGITRNQKGSPGIKRNQMESTGIKSNQNESKRFLLEKFGIFRFAVLEILAGF